MNREEAMAKASKEAMIISLGGSSDKLSFLIDKIYDDFNSQVDTVKEQIFLRRNIRSIEHALPNEVDMSFLLRKDILKVINENM